MPIYVYKPENPAEDGDVEVERLFHGTPPERIRANGVWLVRTPVTRPALVGLKPPPSQGDEMLRGYHARECDLGSRFRSRFSAEMIRRTWENDTLTPEDTASPTTTLSPS